MELFNLYPVLSPQEDGGGGTVYITRGCVNGLRSQLFPWDKPKQEDLDNSGDVSTQTSEIEQAALEWLQHFGNRQSTDNT